MYEIIEDTKAVRIAKEARFTNPIVVSTKRTERFFDCYKTFLYSKVVNAAVIAGIDEALIPAPYLHCIAIPNSNIIIQYVWDSRVIVNAFESSKVAKAIKTAPLEKCPRDVYSAFGEAAILVNPEKFELAFDAMKLAKDWVEPKLGVALYNHDKNRGVYEFEITLDAPNMGFDIYVGKYEYFEAKNTSIVDIDKSLLSDIYPLAKKMRGANKLKQNGPCDFDTILDLLLNMLTES